MSSDRQSGVLSRIILRWHRHSWLCSTDKSACATVPSKWDKTPDETRYSRLQPKPTVTASSYIRTLALPPPAVGGIEFAPFTVCSKAWK